MIVSKKTVYILEMQTLPTDEKDSVTMYGGFYIGRYEAGVKGAQLTSQSNSSITDETEQQNWTGWTGDEIKIVVQKEQQVWNYITRNRAETDLQIIPVLFAEEIIKVLLPEIQLLAVERVNS